MITSLTGKITYTGESSTDNHGNSEIDDISAIHELAVVGKEGNTMADTRDLGQHPSDVGDTPLDYSEMKKMHAWHKQVSFVFVCLLFVCYYMLSAVLFVQLR